LSPKQEALLRTLHSVALGAMAPHSATEALGLGAHAVQRVALYRELIRRHHWAAMEKLYAFTKPYIPSWEQAMVAYFEACPPDHHEPNQLGRRFPDWLVSNAGTLGLSPFVPELAVYEWTEFAVYSAPNQAPTLRGGAHALNPTTALVPFRFDIAGLVRSGEHLHTREPHPLHHALLVFRHPDALLCRFLVLNPAAALTLSALEAATCPVAALSANGVPESRAKELVEELVRVGLLLEVGAEAS
jgi:hypothetical protein